jgi:macrolide transport system ATP-binding/permease protein
MAFLSLAGIGKQVGAGAGRQSILSDVSFAIERGEFVAIVGQSGSGKSTLMNMLGCLDTPDSGAYLIDGRDTVSMSPDELADLRSRTFGFVFQRYNLLGSLTALDNVILPSIYLGLPPEQRRERALSLLGSLGLEDKAGSRPNEMSGGQQQRVSIARALMNGGKVILADEPTGALDSQSGAMVMDILTRLNQQGHTVILVTHDAQVAAFAARTIELRDGRIIREERRAEAPSPVGADTPSPAPATALRLWAGQLAECFSMAVQSILAHKLRSALTMLGLIIGIASVIVVIALGRGSQEQVLERMSSLGTNTIDIMRGAGWGDRYAYRVTTLVPADADALAEQGYLDGATPEVSSSGSLIYRNETFKARVTGVNELGFEILGKRVVQGRGFTPREVRDSATVAVLEQSVRDRIFSPGEDPIGRFLVFNKLVLEVVGIIKDREGKSDSQSETLRVYAPYTTVMYKISGSLTLNAIVARVADGVNNQLAERNIEALLLARHGKKDFFTYNIGTFQEAMSGAAKSTAALIGGIASVSLLVGGIGVLNIMLVSVTERTGEIGLRMALGARRRNILAQFLIEAVLLCLAGGFVGILAALGMGLGFEYFSDAIPMRFSPDSVVLAVFCASLVGIVFGYMPARSASRLDPIEALMRD